ncbi:MAG: right-handed parallel beta-helix repeat-containing protein [Bacteroidota bacterium]
MNQLAKFLCFLSLSIFLGLQSCGGDSSATTDNQTTTTEETANSTLRYPWVDQLNIRESANLRSRVVATVDSGEALELAGEPSEAQEAAVLRGVVYLDNWYKVKTAAGVEGWVFGGAIKQKEEEKGNAPITLEQFDFLYFGSFDLTTWELVRSNENDPESDVSGEIVLFQKEDRYLEVETAESEYYDLYQYKLMDLGRNVLKLRTFRREPAETESAILFTEKVIDYTASPAKEYLRTQAIPSKYFPLNADPKMATGQWTTQETEELPEASYEEVQALYRLVEAGGDIKLPARAYLLDRPIEIIRQEEPTTLDGGGSTFTMLRLNEDVVKVAGSYDITLKNFKATHIEPDGFFACTGNVIHVDASVNVRIEQCELNGSGIIGVMAYSSTNLQIVDNYIYNNSRYGILIDDGSDVKVQNNRFEKNGPTGNNHVGKARTNDMLGEIESLNADNSREGLQMTGNSYSN